MDIRVVESIPTSGGLADPSFRITNTVENVSLSWDEQTGELSVVDSNMNYNLLPWQLYDNAVKKVFLTYNGKAYESSDILETVLVESKNEGDVNQIPGYFNSNSWAYKPSTFHYPTEILEMTNISDYATLPYDYREGFTVVKQFLTAQANVTPGTPAYTAFYRAPTLTNFIPANVEGNKIYTDGWYTSYVCVVKRWSTADPINTNTVATGDILYFEDDKSFYINLTGVPGSLILDTEDNISKPDTVNWKRNPTFADWQKQMIAHNGPTTVNDNLYYIETQHLVTVELNKAILSELEKNCNCCDNSEFGMSALKDYMRLIQKRLGAWVQFNKGLYHEAACILESSRPLCNLCLYHNHCLTTPRGKC